MEGYSLTEAQMATIANPASGPKKTGSIGMPLPDVDLRLVDVETGTLEVAPGEQGELLLNAPQLMRGYWERPEATANALRKDGYATARAVRKRGRGATSQPYGPSDYHRTPDRSAIGTSGTIPSFARKDCRHENRRARPGTRYQSWSRSLVIGHYAPASSSAASGLSNQSS